MISVVLQGEHTTWLDTTPEVAPFGYMIGVLRDKPALVIPADKSPALVTTPADPPSKALQTFRIEAKLSDSGTLTGKVERTVQGDDNEVLLRFAFRNVPLPQWKDLIQRISYASGFAGDIRDVTAGSPEKIDGPFHFGYGYTREDYPDWSNRRVSPPLPPISLPALPDKGQPAHPMWLGSPSEVLLESRVELPKGYTPQAPKAVEIKEDFAEYHASYAIKDDILTTERRLVVKLHEVPTNEYEAYRKFCKTVEGDHDIFIALSSGRQHNISSYQDEIWDLPYSDNSEAASAYDEARNKYQQNDTQGEIEALTHAVEIDPKFTRAWLWLGEIYKFTRQPDLALQSYRKSIDIDPQQPVSYKALGFTLLLMGKCEEAIPVWQKLIKVAPDDSAGSEGLGSCMLILKGYGEASSALESAIKLNPQASHLYTQLGQASLATGDDDKALTAYQKALELDPRPVMFNDIGYELADANKKLDVALQYALKAVSQEEEASQKIKLSDLQVASNLIPPM